MTKDTFQNIITEKIYFKNDTISQIIHLLKTKNRFGGILEGKNYEYYESGRLKYDVDYHDNRLNGEVKVFFENGNLKRIDHYSKGKLIDGKCYTMNGQDTTYYIFQKSASYHGEDIEGFRRIIAKNLEYPEEAQINGIQGQVLVQFSVNSEGELINAIVLKSPNKLLSWAALKAIYKTDKWEPAIKEGKNTKQRFVIPVDFVMQ
jgi:protein TonB